MVSGECEGILGRVAKARMMMITRVPACVGVCLARDFLCVRCEGVLFFAALWGVCGMEAAHGSEQWDAPCCKHAR